MKWPPERRARRHLYNQFFASGDNHAIRRFRPGALDLICDLGANVGIFSVMARCLHPEARIVAIEPDRANYCALMENVRGLGIVAYRAAVGTDGLAQHVLSGKTCLHHRWDTAPRYTSKRGRMPSLSLSAILAKWGAPGDRIYIKSDIEGAEHHFVGNAESESAIRRCTCVALSFHASPKISRMADFAHWLEIFHGTHQITAGFGRRAGFALLIAKNCTTVEVIV